MLSVVPRDLLDLVKRSRGKQADEEVNYAKVKRVSHLFEMLVAQASTIEACPEMSRTRRWYFLKFSNTRKRLEEEGVGVIIIKYILQAFGNVVFPVSDRENALQK